MNANVALATHGQSVSEVMGNGSASMPNQSFVLKQSPLTYVQAPTPTGRQSTLEVAGERSQVDRGADVSTTKRVGASLHHAEPVRRQPPKSFSAITWKEPRCPLGKTILQANYRIGSGSAGNVAAGALTTLMDRPLGVSGVTNPEAQPAARIAQSIDDVRSNAPQTVLTLGRAVSITDYQSYAATFAGIAKAYAIWIPSGPGKRCLPDGSRRRLAQHCRPEIPRSPTW